MDTKPILLYLASAPSHSVTSVKKHTAYFMQGVKGLRFVGDEQSGVDMSKSMTFFFDCCHDMLRCLEGLHQAGIVHGDVKPANFCMFNPKASKRQNETLVIIDFGASNTSL